MSDSAEESEFPKHEKTEEEKERLREERRLRRTKKKYEAKAEKRGMTVEQYLKVKSTAPEPKKTAKSPSTHKSNPKKRAREEETPKENTTIYMGNLAYKAGEPEIRRFFQPMGFPETAIVKITFPSDKESGKQYGVAFVEFEKAEYAHAAVAKNGVKILGRPITIQMSTDRNEAKKQKLKENGDSGAAAGEEASTSRAKANSRPVEENDGSCVFVGAVSDEAKDEDIMKFFAGAGPLRTLRRIYDKKTKEFTGALFIQYVNATVAKRAVEALHNKDFFQRRVRVELAKQKTAK